jgi:hypothetical protein
MVLSVAVALCALVGVALFFVPPGTQVANARNVQMSGADDAWILDLPGLLEEQAAVVETAEATPAQEGEMLIPAAAEETDADLPGWLILATSKEGTP